MTSMGKLGFWASLVTRSPSLDAQSKRLLVGVWIWGGVFLIATGFLVAQTYFALTGAKPNDALKDAAEQWDIILIALGAIWKLFFQKYDKVISLIQKREQNTSTFLSGIRRRLISLAAMFFGLLLISAFLAYPASVYWFPGVDWGDLAKPFGLIMAALALTWQVFLSSAVDRHIHNEKKSTTATKMLPAAQQMQGNRS